MGEILDVLFGRFTFITSLPEQIIPSLSSFRHDDDVMYICNELFHTQKSFLVLLLLLVLLSINWISPFASNEKEILWKVFNLNIYWDEEDLWTEWICENENETEAYKLILISASKWSTCMSRQAVA